MLSRLKNSIFYKKLQYHFYPTIRYLRETKLLKRYATCSDPRQFNWDWSKINFNRIALVNLLLNKFPNPTYLEIGCAENALFDSVPVLNKIGVDPVSGGNIRKTSDEFFLENQQSFDVIFIDGLHTYEQVRKDVINALAHLTPNGFLVLHDMLPRTWIEHHTPPIKDGPWAGDVWKVGLELSNTPGIDFKILKIDHGVGLARLINPDVNLVDMQPLLRDANFGFFADNVENLPIVDWNTGLRWLNE